MTSCRKKLTLALERSLSFCISGGVGLTPYLQSVQLPSLERRMASRGSRACHNTLLLARAHVLSLMLQASRHLPFILPDLSDMPATLPSPSPSPTPNVEHPCQTNQSHAQQLPAALHSYEYVDQLGIALHFQTPANSQSLAGQFACLTFACRT